jgi:hypothetical protein
MEDQDLPLRRRVPGAARAGPGSSVAPVLSDSVLERMQAAIDAARADPAGHDSDPDTEPIPRVAGNAPAKADKHAAGVNGVPVKPDSGARPPRSAKRRRTSTAINNVRHGRIARPQETAPTASAQPAPAGKAQPSGESPPPLPMRTVPTPAADLNPQVTAEQADSREQADARKQADSRKPQIPAARADAQPVTPPRPASQPAPAAAAQSATGQAAAQASPELAASAADARPSPNVSPAPRHLAAVHAPPTRRAQPDQRARRRRFSTARLVAAAVVVLAVAAAASALVLHRQPSAGHKLTPLQRQAIANQAGAVFWIKQQVTPGTQISCDKLMCAALAAAGYLNQDLNVLGPASSGPPSSRLVIDTAAVRSQFGSSLESAIAPLALTTVGSGQARISIRLVAPHGPAALKQSLAAEQRARQQNEAVLPGGPIATSTAARADLTKGSVDTRLAFAIVSMAPSLPVDILGFGNVATGGSSDLPLRFADLAESDPAAHMTSGAYAAALQAAISKIPGPYRPLWVKPVRLSPGTTVLRVDVGAPS